MSHANGLRGVSAAQFTHEAVDRLIAAAIAVPDQPDPAKSPWRYGRDSAHNSMVSRYGSQALAVTAGLEALGWRTPLEVLLQSR